MKACVLKYDHFENIHRLDAKLPSYEGAPNFRQVRLVNSTDPGHCELQVPGYLVFGTGQPTKLGFENALRFIFSESGAKDVLWTNMRQVSHNTQEMQNMLYKDNLINMKDAQSCCKRWFRI